MSAWSLARAEREIAARELFGIRFGLDRMRRLCAALAEPQKRFRAIHIVGTNGKTSTARMTTALLEAHGVTTGTFTSPHLVSVTERIRIADAVIEPQLFAAAIQTAAEAAAMIETDSSADHVTQFELLTAAAFCAFATANVAVAVVEAGLGGRLDATNVLDAEVVGLTDVSLEHQRWLGNTVQAIAAEKLAVVSRGARLVVAGGSPAVLETANAVAQRCSSQLTVTEDWPGTEPLGYQRRNFAVAHALASASIGELNSAITEKVAARSQIPGRVQHIADNPLTIFDGAHNPAGMHALVAALPELIGGRQLVAVVSILDDKDAKAMLKELLPSCAQVIITVTSNARAFKQETLMQFAHELGFTTVTGQADPAEALSLAKKLAGSEGAVLATGSTYLVAELLRGLEFQREVAP